jgi:peptidoglycan hydrolase-like protein with peptidoglycan-binding domain
LFLTECQPIPSNRYRPPAQGGLFSGNPYNVMGERTKTALARFQKDKGLPTGNLDIETLKALGITAH